jgi:hypothetical protein
MTQLINAKSDEYSSSNICINETYEILASIYSDDGENK